MILNHGILFVWFLKEMNIQFYIIKFKDFLKLIDVNNYNIKFNTFDRSKEIEKSSCIFSLKI